MHRVTKKCHAVSYCLKLYCSMFLGCIYLRLFFQISSKVYAGRMFMDSSFPIFSLDTAMIYSIIFWVFVGFIMTSDGEIVSKTVSNACVFQMGKQYLDRIFTFESLQSLSFINGAYCNKCHLFAKWQSCISHLERARNFRHRPHSRQITKQQDWVQCFPYTSMPITELTANSE